MALGLFLPMVFCFAAAKPGEPDERYRMASVVELERSEKIQSDTPFEDEKIAAKEVSRKKKTKSFSIGTSQRVLSTQTAAKERMEKKKPASEKKRDLPAEAVVENRIGRLNQMVKDRRNLPVKDAVKDRIGTRQITFPTQTAENERRANMKSAKKS